MLRFTLARDFSACPNSTKMQSFPESLLSGFYRYSKISRLLKACHFDKTLRKKKICDLTGVLPYHVALKQLNREVVNEEMNEMGFEWTEDVEFNFDDQRVYVTFNRNTCCRHTLNLISDSRESYGSNNDLSQKPLSLSLEADSDDQSLTSCRKQITFEILRYLINFCGGQCSDSSFESLNLLISHKSSRRSNGSLLILVGPVKCDDAPSLDAYTRLRAEEIAAMCENKLENQVFMNDCPKELARAALRFDLMQSTLNRSVLIHLNYSDLTTLTRCKGAVFVMYNYVRIEHILNKFNDDVTSKKYPELLPADEINFSDILNEDEWNLILSYVMSWPCVVREIVEGVFQSRPKLHKLFLFLTSLSSDFSAYYRRTRILLSGKSHLIPLVHARIHVLLGIRQVYRNALEVIGLKPLKNM